MGEAVRKKVNERFPAERFATRFRRSIERAQEKWETRRLSGAYFSLTLSDENEKLQLLVKSGYFLRLSDQFQDCIRSMEVEEAVGVLDEIMKPLGMLRNICISGFEDLTRITLDVSDHLRELRENRAAGSLLRQP